MNPAGTGRAVGSGEDFQPNQEMMRELQGMGFDQNVAAQALFFSGNSSTDAAVSWIFDNQGQSPQVPSGFGMGTHGPVSTWDSQPSTRRFDPNEEYTMVIVMNTSLGMSPGKLAAQAAHASLGGYRAALEANEECVPAWIADGERTIVVGADSAPHLESLHNRANDRGLVSVLVSDAGRTQVAQGAKTALCLFGERSKVDAITGTLRPL